MASAQIRTIKDVSRIGVQCTGCGACAVSCPAGAIVMCADEEGFMCPNLSVEVCVGCGKCLNVCQAACELDSATPLSVSGVCASSSGKRAAGSSGGVMGILAERVLQSGGVVFGAAFDAEAKRVVHVSTDDVSLSRILRSKYVQSDAWPVYVRVKKALRSGIPVLFCGTPCQVAGLKRFLGKGQQNLLTVDFFCHGVPSPGFFTDYAELKECKKGCRLADMTFREKTHGWREQHMRWYYANGAFEEEPSLSDCYYFFFLGNYSLRKSCYECGLYEKHCSDITLADYWLIDSSDDDDLGASLVLANTDAGACALAEIDAEVFEVPVKSFDIGIYRHGYDTCKRAEFFSRYIAEGVEGVCGVYFNDEHRKWIMDRKLGSIKGAIAVRLKRLFGGACL